MSAAAMMAAIVLGGLAPDKFGAWLNIPDREENADGSPVGGYR